MRASLLALALLFALGGCKKPEPIAPPPSAPPAPVAARPSASAPAAPAPVAPVDPGPMPTDLEALYKVDALGPLQIGMPAAKVEAALGAPKGRTPPAPSEATGTFFTEWAYPDAGVTVTLEGPEQAGPFDVAGFSVRAPSPLATRWGVAVGSAREKVEAIYGKAVADGAALGPEGFVAGSLYGGIAFSYADGKVESIAFGAFAE